jgi:hypothetical protein
MPSISAGVGAVGVVIPVILFSQGFSKFLVVLGFGVKLCWRHIVGEG